MSPSQTLQQTQAWIKHALTHPLQANQAAIATTINPSARLNSNQCLAIYQRSYYLRLLKCMQEQFPALSHALGEDLFRDFACEYLQTYPSQSYTLYDLGNRFPQYLKETRPDFSAKESEQEDWINFMIDLACFELSLFLMFDAPGHEGKPLPTMETPDERLVLQPCFHIAEYLFPVAEYYHDVKRQAEPVMPQKETSRVAIVRKNFLTHTSLLTLPHYTFLKALQQGESIAVALAHVAHTCSIPLDDVTQSWKEPNGIRQRWIQAAFFIEL